MSLLLLALAAPAPAAPVTGSVTGLVQVDFVFDNRVARSKDLPTYALQAARKRMISGGKISPKDLQRLADAGDGLAAFRFTHLPAGTYAVMVFHDENDNGKIDHGLLGPSEPLGFSGGFTLGLFSGRPDFERLKFAFNPPEQTLEVRMR